MSISKRINKLMEKQGLSRYKLAKLSKVPYTTLIKVLDGDKPSEPLARVN